MPGALKTLRFFISSPGDVGRERHATAEIIRRLQSEFAEHVTLDPYFWEWEPVDFSKDYQANIPSTADFDIVICILWSRLGSRLSDQHKLPPDYTRPASSGTEYELLQALHGQQQHPDRLPDLLVWKNESPPPPASAPPLTREEEDERIRQRRALQDFLTSVTKDAATGSFIAALNSYQYLDQFEELMEGKLRKLIQKHIGQRTVKPKPQWQGSPFRDLDVFEFEHAPIFFGRSRAIGEVVRLLQHTLSKPQPCHFALILGASGSGKSSLARAGVLPLLTRPGVIEGIGLWRCAIVRPSDDSADLFQALAAALLAGKKVGVKDQNSEPFTPNLLPALPELADPESCNPQDTLAAELRAHPQTVAIRVKDQLHAVAKAHQTQQRHTLEAQIASLIPEGRQADAALKQQALQNLQEPKARLVLLLDQMEELFTLNYASEQLRDFLETIAVLARSGRVFVIGTLRSDFYPRYQEQPALVALARDGARFDLLPPTPDEISQIIRRPASLAALQFEPHATTAEHTLADTLRDEALADTEALPLLEHVLNRLYQAQLPRADGRLTFADYEEICGVDLDPKTGVKTCRGVGGALGKHAEDIFTGQNRQPTDPPPPWTEETFRAVFRCLVTFGKGEGDTDVPNRRTFTYKDLIQNDPAAQALVDTFIRERLLIADTDAQARAIVRLSHEALLSRWSRVVAHIAANREMILLRTKVASRMTEGLPIPPDDPLFETVKRSLYDDPMLWASEHREYIAEQLLNARRRKLRRCFISIFSVSVFIIVYAALADANVHVVGADRIKRWIDVNEASVFRPVPTTQQIEDSAAEIGGYLHQELIRTWDQAIQVGFSDTLEPWSAAQSVTACVDSDHTDHDLMKKALYRLSVLLRPNLRKEYNGTQYGWEMHERGFAQAEPALWILSSLAMAKLRFGNDLNSVIPDYSERLEYAQTVADSYRNAKFQGLWNMFANQEKDTEYSLCTTALAFRTLLDLKEANAGWHGSSTDLDVMISSIADQLQRSFSDDGSLLGWRQDAPGGWGGGGFIWDGISLDVFASLLRANHLCDVPINSSLLNSMDRYLARLADRSLDYPVQTYRLIVRATNFDGTTRPLTNTVVCPWIPAGIAACSNWLSWSSATAEPQDHSKVVAVKRSLAHLLALVPEAGHSKERRMFLFEVCELIHASRMLSRLEAGLSKK